MACKHPQSEVNVQASTHQHDSRTNVHTDDRFFVQKFCFGEGFYFHFGLKPLQVIARDFSEGDLELLALSASSVSSHIF